MASIKEILAAEVKTDHSIRLYRDGGLFYKCYERSAYLFVHQVREYQAMRKYFKVCMGDVVSVSFLQKTLPTLACQYVENADGTVSIPVETEIDEQQFLKWKEQVPLWSPKPVSDSPLPLAPAPTMKPSAVTDEDGAEVLHRLRQYNLAGSTPMEAMLFISELQRMLNKVKGTAV